MEYKAWNKEHEPWLYCSCNVARIRHRHHIRDVTDKCDALKKNMKNFCLFVILSYKCWYTTIIRDKISDRNCFSDINLCQVTVKLVQWCLPGDIFGKINR